MKTQLVKTGMAILVGLVLFPVAAGAQTPEQRVDAALTRAEAAGIPKSLLENKIAEGKAKGIDMTRIAAAIEARLDGLTKARAAMTKGGTDVDAAELSVGADAIGAGVGAAVLEKIAATTGHDRRAVAVAALTQLVEQGVAPEAALTRVQDALARGPQALANLATLSGGHAPEGVGGPGVGGTTSSSATGGGGAVSGPPTSVPTPGQQRGGRGGL